MSSHSSWTWMSVSFPRLGKFSAIISSNMFSVPPHLFCLCFWGLLYCMCCYAWCCPRDLLNFSHLFLFLFPSFCSGSGFPLLCLSAYWWVSLHCLFCFWLLLCIFQLFYYWFSQIFTHQSFFTHCLYFLGHVGYLILKIEF